MKTVLDHTLTAIAKAAGYHQLAREFGQRAWRVKGRFTAVRHDAQRESFGLLERFRRT